MAASARIGPDGVARPTAEAVVAFAVGEREELRWRAKLRRTVVVAGDSHAADAVVAVVTGSFCLGLRDGGCCGCDGGSDRTMHWLALTLPVGASRPRLEN